MNTLSLFSGIGGLDLAAEWAGFKTTTFVERNKYCQEVLAKHWPGVPIYDDVTTFRGTDLQDIDIISGGFPCQPHSVAGKRKASGDERDLWGEFKRIIGEVKPRWVVAENVPGLFSSESGRFFGRVLRDLAALGYDAVWVCYGAVDVGAKHKRDRVFIIAKKVGNTKHVGQLAAKISRSIAQGSDHNTTGKKSGCEPARPSDGIVADTIGNRPQGIGKDGNAARQAGLCGGAGGDKIKNLRNAASARLPDWCGGQMGKPKEITEFERPSGREIECDFRGISHGVSRRVDRLRALGNAVVPQQAYPIFAAIAETYNVK